MKKTIQLDKNLIIFNNNDQKTEILSRYVKVNGLKTHYIETGKGKTIIFLPGWPGSWRVYIEFISKLSKNYRVIGLDLPGFAGKTKASNLRHTLFFYVKFLEEFINEIDENKVYLIGISMGGGNFTSFWRKTSSED